MHRGKEYADKSRSKGQGYQRWRSLTANADEQGECASHKSDCVACQESGKKRKQAEYRHQRNTMLNKTCPDFSLSLMLP